MLEGDPSKRNKRELVLAGKMSKGHQLLGVEEKLGIKPARFGEKSDSAAH